MGAWVNLEHLQKALAEALPEQMTFEHKAALPYFSF
jgi:hypothetical protein